MPCCLPRSDLVLLKQGFHAHWELHATGVGLLVLYNLSGRHQAGTVGAEKSASCLGQGSSFAHKKCTEARQGRIMIFYNL